MKQVFFAVLGLISFTAAASGQNGDLPAQLGYPQLIVHNAKIVTMDDSSFESRVGNITEAMAIRDRKILATGTNAKIRALAGPQTRLIDLHGKTVLPSFVLAQEHPTDWVFIEPRAFRHVLPDDEVIVSRWLPRLPPRQQIAMFEPLMREAVAKAKPGQWIRVIFNWGPNYELRDELMGLFQKSITREWLDVLAPNNPVTVKSGFISPLVNSKAVEEFRSVHSDIDVWESGRLGNQRDPEREQKVARSGRLATLVSGRPVDADAMMKGRVQILAELIKAEMELWASWGVTTFGSAAYAYSNLRALRFLDRTRKIPSRFAWTYTGPSWDLESLRFLAMTVGHGTDNLWFIGAFHDRAGDCMTVPETAKWKQRYEQTGAVDLTAQVAGCVLEPGMKSREILERIVESGLRIATMHTGGDKDVDNLMDAIEAGSAKAGFTLEEIRAKRHAFDHGTAAPRPDQIPRIKKLGMMASQGNAPLWEGDGVFGASGIAEKYGIQYTDWVVPRKRMTEAGIPTSFEVDRPLPHKIFLFMAKGMTRHNEKDQQVYGPEQKTDRIIQLKAMTRWGALYVLRENLLGSLEPGKFADFIVLDNDILTIPENQIPHLRVLMTAVGGHVIHLTPAFASEIGMTAVGPSTWKDSLPAGWE